MVLSHLFFWGIQCLQGAKRGAQEKRTLATASSADCSMLSPAVPSAVPPPSTQCRVGASEVPFPQASGRSGSGGIALESSVLFQEPSMAKQDTWAAVRLQTIFVSCNFSPSSPELHPSKTRESLTAVGDTANCSSPALPSAPASPAWGQEETLCLKVWGLSRSLSCATTSSRKP